MSIVRIAYSANFADIGVMRAFLAEHGVPALEPRMSSHVSIAGVDQGYYLEVLREDATKARGLLRDNSFEIFVVENRAGGFFDPGYSDG